MDLLAEIYQQIIKDMIAPPKKLKTRGARPPYGMLVKAPGDQRLYRIVSPDELFENVRDFPRRRAGPDWLLIAVGDDAGTSAFTYPWDMVKDAIVVTDSEDWCSTPFKRPLPRPTRLWLDRDQFGAGGSGSTGSQG